MAGALANCYTFFMEQLRLFGLLLRPSLLSGSICFGAATFVLGVSFWSYATRFDFISDVLFGQNGITASLRDAVDNSDVFSQVFNDATIMYGIAIFLAAVATGFIVYIVLELSERVISNVSESYLSFFDTDAYLRKISERELLVKIMLRTFVLVAWFLYTIFFNQVLLPFCILTAKIDVGSVDIMNQLSFSALGYALFLLGLHLHVIFLRLFVLKPRVFGGEQEIIEALE